MTSLEARCRTGGAERFEAICDDDADPNRWPAESPRAESRTLSGPRFRWLVVRASKLPSARGVQTEPFRLAGLYPKDLFQFLRSCEKTRLQSVPAVFRVVLFSRIDTYNATSIQRGLLHRRVEEIAGVIARQ